MNERANIRHKGILLFISVAAMLFALVCGGSANGADFKSEEDLLDDTRANVEKHLNDKWQASSPVIEEKAVVEAPKIAKEVPIIKEETFPVKEEQAPANNDEAAIAETPAKTSEAPAEKEKVPAASEEAAVAKQDSPAVQSSDVKQDPQPPENKEDARSEVITMDPESNSVTKSDKVAVGEDIKFIKGIQEPVKVKPLVEPVLKKMDVTRIGSSPYYETYEGLRLLKYFTVAQRVEIYQEARPIDAYIMDAYAMRYDNWPHTPWNIKSDYRTQLTPVFTRAYGTEITFSDPKNKEGQVRYTHDYREIYRNYYPKWPQIKKEMWDQNEILFMHSKQIEPLGWNYTSNLGYRYSTLNDKENETWSSWRPSNMGPANEFDSYDNIRQTYFASLSLAPSEKLEWFGQGEYFKAKYINCAWAYDPDHFMGRMEIRIKSNDMKTIYVPSFSYSKDYYMPFADTYQKYEIQYRVGRDFTKKFSATSTVKYVMGIRDVPDHRDWMDGGPWNRPYKDKAYTLSLENRFSYNVYDRLYLQFGADISNGLNWSVFDNVAYMSGLEYYAPGMIRVDFGWSGNYYYNVQDFMSSIYFKVYFFM